MDAVVDATVDFGEAVVPREVRVVDAQGAVIPSVVESKSGTAFDLLFRTGFAVGENRDFEVYWGNPAAPVQEVTEDALFLEVGDKEVRFANGAVEAVFDNFHSTASLMKSFHIAGSEAQSEFLTRPSGTPWKAFGFQQEATNWSPVIVVSDNALKKTIAFSNKNLRVDFTLYAGQPRVDYTYTTAMGTACRDYVSWAANGGCAYDDLVYPDLNGNMKATPAALDFHTDQYAAPDANLTTYLNGNWYAVRDRKSGSAAGIVFDRRATSKLSVYGYGGSHGCQIQLWDQFYLNNATDDRVISKKGRWVYAPAVGRYALVGSLEGAAAVRREARRFSTSTRVFTGTAETAALPSAAKLVEAKWNGPRIVADFPNGTLPDAPVDPDFRPLRCVEFYPAADTLPSLTRSVNGKLEVTRMSSRQYTRETFATALATASYLHLVGVAADQSDPIFADCAAELKALLARGGGILFDKSITSPNARAFLAEVGVSDPNAGAIARSDVGVRGPDYDATHSFEQADGTTPDTSSFPNTVKCSRAFKDWDAEKMYAPLVCSLDSGAAIVLCQENVNGTGRICFNQNDYAFVDSYENFSAGQRILSWLLQTSLNQHRLNVNRYIGGPGTLVEN